MEITNEVTQVLNQPAVKSFLTELVAYIVPIIASGIVAGMGIWVRSILAKLKKISAESETKSDVIDVMVRGVQNSPGETEFVKRSIRNEAIEAGVESHVNSAVKEVKATMAEENKVDKSIYEKNVQNNSPAAPNGGTP